MFKALLSKIAQSLGGAGLPYMIIGGQFAGRPRDLEDADAILIKNPAVDRGYILTWLREFDRTMDTHDFTDRFSELCDQSGCDGP